MRVLQLINSLAVGGAENLVINTSLLFQQKGIVSDVLTLSDQECTYTDFFKKKTKNKLVGLTKRSIYNPFLVFRIIPYLKKYDLVHVHLFPALYWTVIAKWISFSKTTLVYTEHSTQNRRRKNVFFKMADRIIYKAFSKLICISHGTEKELKKHLGATANKKTITIHNGIDLQKYILAGQYEKEMFFSDSDIFLIQVSNFKEQKDQPTIIRALMALPEKVKLLLVGEGKLKRKCMNLANELGVAHRVNFLGLRSDIPSLLKMCDIVILSSHHEGFGLAIVEGMAAGKPVIASNIEGISEIVGKYGLLFEQGNDKDLAELVLKLINDFEYNTLIARKCFERAKDFEIGKMVTKYLSIYYECCPTKVGLRSV